MPGVTYQEQSSPPSHVHPQSHEEDEFGEHCPDAVNIHVHTAPGCSHEFPSHGEHGERCEREGVIFDSGEGDGYEEF
jgi:hypothetical protein